MSKPFSTMVKTHLNSLPDDVVVTPYQTKHKQKPNPTNPIQPIPLNQFNPNPSALPFYNKIQEYKANKGSYARV